MSAGEKTESGKSGSLKQRRNYIVRHMRSRGIISWERLEADLGAPSRQAIRYDIEELNSLGFNIEKVSYDGRSYLVDASARHLFTKRQRVQINSQHKQAVGSAAAGLILGLPPLGSQASKLCDSHNPELRDCPTRENIIEALDDQESTTGSLVLLKDALESFWKEQNRQVFLDSGTTNDRAAEYLRDVILPTSYSPLTGLSVCTNSRGMFSMLAEPEVGAKAIIVGGSQIGETESLAGTLSEFFLKQAKSLRFGICLLGATQVDLRSGRFYLCSDSFEEATLKSIALEKSLIRAVCVDHTKFSESPMREGFPFASINPSQIDLVITSRPSGRGSEEQKDHCSRVEMIKARGVPVLEGHVGKRTETGYSFEERISFSLPRTTYEAAIQKLDLSDGIPPHLVLQKVINSWIIENSSEVKDA